MSTVRQIIQNKIAASKASDTLSDLAAQNLNDLVKVASEYELRQEREKLLQLCNSKSSDEELKNSFRQLCAQRAERNKNFSLFYFAMQASQENQYRCNLLYWELAQTLFQPKTLGEMLAILFPCITSYLDLEVRKLRKTIGGSQWQAEFLSCDLANLDVPVRDMTQLSNYIFVEGKLFNTDHLAALDLAQHQVVYLGLNDAKYPKLKELLYRHNEHYQVLLTDIETTVNGMQTPQAMLERLIENLKKSGETYHGQTLAPETVKVHIKVLTDYLAALPDDMRREILALGNGRSLTKKKQNSRGEIIGEETFQLNVEYVIYKHLLEYGSCVEVAAKLLREIIVVNRNTKSLTQLPDNAHELTTRIQKKYARNKDEPAVRKFPSQRNYTAYQIPGDLLRECFANFRSDSPDAYITLLLDFPPDKYLEIFTALPQISIGQQIPLLSVLANYWSGNYFTEEQKQAIEQIILHPKKIFSETYALYFLIKVNSQHAISAFNNLKYITIDGVSTALKIAVQYNNAIMVDHILKKHPRENELVELIIEAFKQNDAQNSYKTLLDSLINRCLQHEEITENLIRTLFLKFDVYGISDTKKLELLQYLLDNFKLTQQTINSLTKPAERYNQTTFVYFLKHVQRKITFSQLKDIYPFLLEDKLKLLVEQTADITEQSSKESKNVFTNILDKYINSPALTELLISKCTIAKFDLLLHCLPTAVFEKSLPSVKLIIERCPASKHKDLVNKALEIYKWYQANSIRNGWGKARATPVLIELLCAVLPLDKKLTKKWAEKNDMPAEVIDKVFPTTVVRAAPKIVQNSQERQASTEILPRNTQRCYHKISLFSLEHEILNAIVGLAILASTLGAVVLVTALFAKNISVKNITLGFLTGKFRESMKQEEKNDYTHRN